jgi:protein-disulfide isomerase
MMIFKNRKDTLLKIVFIAGLVFAVLSALESRVDWIASFCSFWGNGCRETGQFSVFHLPVALWGVGYYILLVFASFFASRALFFLVMAGAGVELSLVLMMIEMKWACVLCLVNLLVMALAVFFLFDHRRLWQALAISAFCFVVSDHLLVHDGTHGRRPVLRAPAPSVIAQVGDELIRESEVNEPLSGRIYKLERQIYELRNERLNALIENRLIELDAKEKGLSPEVHFYRVSGGDVTVSEDEVERYINQVPGLATSWKGSPQELRSDVRKYLRDKKIREKIDRYTQPLKDRYGVRIYLEPPALPMTSVKEGGSPTLGPVDAPVTVFEYSDYQCPSCRKAHEVSIQIRERFKGRIRWVFKDYPLERHRESRLMAQAARCAGEQERFWEYQDLLYTGSSRPDSETLVGFARQLELDEAAFSQCLDDGKYQAIIEKEKAAARDSGVSSTPTFIINGRLSPGYMSFDRMAALIEQELEKFD